MTIVIVLAIVTFLAIKIIMDIKTSKHLSGIELRIKYKEVVAR